MTFNPQRWEYAFVSKPLDYLLVGDLNEAGKDGWEVITISYEKDLKGNWAWTAFFKRPLSETGEPGPATWAPGATASSGLQSSGGAKVAGNLQGFELPDGDFEFKEGE